MARRFHALTHPQKRVWYAEQLYPKTPLHNIAGVATVRGAVDFPRLEAAFNLLVQAHDAMRIRIVAMPGGEARQYIAEHRPFFVSLVDFLREGSSRAEFQRWLEGESARPFDLGREALFRVHFFRVSAEEWGYLVVCHHIISDGWSFQVLAAFISEAYRERAMPALTPPSYLELAEEEASYASSRQFERDRSFWLDELSGAPRAPIDQGGSAGEQLRVRVDAEAAGRVRRFAADAGVSLASLYTALLFAYLRGREDADDIVLGMPVANRPGRRKRAFGMFASTMPLRMRLHDGELVSSFVRRVHANVLRCFRHQRYPYDRLLQDLAVAGQRQQPLFRACVNFYNTDPGNAARLGDDAVKVDEIYVGHQLFPLYVLIKEWSTDGHIELHVNYKPALLRRKDAEGLAGFLLNADALTSSAPGLTVGQLALRAGAGSIFSESPQASAMTVAGKARLPRPESTRFPTSRPRPERADPWREGRLAFRFPAPLQELLEELFGGDRDSHGSALATAVSLLLARCCSLTEIEIGVAGARTREVVDLRCSVDPGEELGALMKAVRHTLSGTARGAASSSKEHGVLLDLRGAGRPQRAPPTSVTIVPPEGDRPGEVVFDASLYQPPEIELLIARLTTVLEAMTRSSHSRVGELEIVGEAERVLLLDRFNQTEATFPGDVTLVNLFEEMTARHPDSVALRVPAGRWSYVRLNQRANQLARALQDQGVGRGTIVPVMVERSPELLVGILGVLKAGAAYLPIDPSHPKARVDFILGDCGAAVVVAGQRSLLADAPGRRVVALDDERSYASDARDLPTVAGPGELAYVCYTSGSTGTPKGAMIEHRSLVNRLHWMQRAYPLGPRDVLLQKTSISFDVSVWELLWWSLAGASLCLASPGEEKSPERLVECIERNGVTIVHFVPSMLQAFLSYVESARKTASLRSLRRVFASGEALRPDHVDIFNRLLAGAGTRLTNLYGPTEATIDVTYHDCPVTEWCARVPIGRPIDNTWLRVLSPSLKLQPVGAPGELYIGGVGVARGYFNRAELTEQRFVSDPYRPGERLYRTGDLARWLPDGEIEFLGRNDDQVKLRGFRIELGEIEAALRRHPAVEDAAVVLRAGAGDAQQLCAYVVPRAPFTTDQLREHLAATLPEYMVPGSLQSIDALPRSASGKVDRAALPEPTRTAVFEPLQTPEEHLLAEIWREVLDAPAVGARDNFFSLGGDSIKVIALVAKARSRGRTFTTEEVYRHPLLRDLARVQHARDGQDVPVARERFGLLSADDLGRLPVTAEDAYPLAALQVGLIYQSQIQRGTGFYHDVFSYRIMGAFDEAKFAQAVRSLCQRHEIFRTTFHLGGFSEPLQVVHADAPELLTVVDLRGMAPAEQELAIQHDIMAIRGESFDWETPDLIGFHIHWLGDSEYLYTIDFHDSALDGWSVNLIHRALFDAYYSLLAGGPLQEEAPRTKYRDFVALEREAVAAPEHRAYWTRVLDNSHFVPLPRWPRRGSPPPCAVGFHEVPLPAGLSDAIKRTANRLGVPPKTVLLAAHVYVLSRLTGEHDVLTGYEYGVRPEGGDGDQVIGLFLNTLPLCVQVQAATWEELVQTLHQAEVDFIPHRRYPMAQMKRDRGARAPLFESVFNFTHFHVLRGLKRLPGLDLQEVKVRAETEFPFRAECSIHPFSDEVLLWIHYHQDAFPAEQIEAIGGYYMRALQALTGDPRSAPEPEALIGNQERHRLLREFNSSERPLNLGRCFPRLFEEQVAASATAVAATCGSEQWSYGALNGTANKLAHMLVRRAAGVQSVVAVAMRRGLPWMATVVACLKANQIYLPLDVDQPVERIGGILSRSNCRLVIAGDEALRRKISEAARTRGADGSVEVLLVEEALHGQPDDNLTTAVSAEDLAYIIFTSGSTGAPKGAMIEHGGMLNHLLAKVHDLRIGRDDVVVQNASACFDISVWQLLAASLVGARVVIIGDSTVADVRTLIETVRRERVSLLEVVPSYLTLMLGLLEQAAQPFAALRYLLVTGEPTKAELLARWFARYPGIPVVNAYGPTEASDDICHHVMTEAPESVLAPVGKPIQNLNIYVLDERLALVPIGASGEVCVTGVGVGRGYINDPERTRAVFVTDPFRPSVRMYRTGDVGRWSPDGVLELAGRKDDQVKVRGYRIETGEIEGRLQQCPGVVQAAVVTDRRSATLVAFVVAERVMDAGALKRELALRLPEYMVPSRIVQVDELPLSSNGKVAKRALLDRLERLAEEAGPASPPQGETEIELARLWANVLKIDEDRIGRHSDFFDLGGHSLKAMELSLRANGRFSINDVVKYPVLEDLARRVNSLASSTEREGLLVEFTRGAEPPSLSIIGFTYAGGNAANFKALFDALQERRRDIACYAVELPRQSRPVPDLESTARLCLEQIRRKVHTPIVLWGHCSGSALALEVARLLEANARELRLVILGGKVIQSRPMARVRNLAARAMSPFMAVDAMSMSASQIMKWLVEKTGFDGFGGLNEEDALFITEAFRHDAVGAARYFERASDPEGTSKIEAPILNIVADDDPLTKGYRTKYKNWKLFSERVGLDVLQGGGHYFIKTRPGQTADLILREVVEPQETGSTDERDRLVFRKRWSES